MANEAQIINNPTSTPEAVSTGYQRQNTRAEAASNGIDRTVITGGTGSATLEISGPIDYNGVFYSITSAVTLTPASAGTWYVYLSGSGDNLTPTITSDSGTFDADKNARYLGTGERVFNWIIYFDGTTCYVNRWVTPNDDTQYDLFNGSPYEEWITANGSWTAPRSQYYTFTITGSGGDGDGTDGYSTLQQASGGGSGGATGIKRIFVEAGDTWTAVFSSSSSGYTTFSDGSTTCQAENGKNTPQDTGDVTVNCDITHNGGYGGNGIITESILTGSQSFLLIGGRGGGSFWGGESEESFINTSGVSAGSNGNSGNAYGGGGSGAVAYKTATTYSGGSGKQGVIRIQG